MYYVYVIECETPNHYYVGLTQNFAERMKQHESGTGSEFMSVHKFKKVVYKETHEWEEDAKTRERELTMQYKSTYGDENVAGGGGSQVRKRRNQGAKLGR